MALNLNTGSMSTDKFSGVHVRQMDPKMYHVMAENARASFVSLLRLIGMKRSAKRLGRNSLQAGMGNNLKNVKSFKFEWEDFFPGTSSSSIQSLTGGQTGTETTLYLPAKEISQFQKNDMIMNKRTKELMLVTAISPSASPASITVTRGWGDYGDSTRANQVGDEIILVGNAWTEGSHSAVARSYNPRTVYNYTQIFKRAIENTATNEATETYGNVNKRQFQRKEEWFQFLLERSRAYYVGKRIYLADLQLDDRHRRTTGGLDYFIKSNILTSKTLTYSNFMDFSKMVYAKGGNEKLLVCNSSFAQLVQEMVMTSKIQYTESPKAKEFGLKIKRLVCIHGDMDLMMDRTMDDLYTLPTAFAIETDLVEEMILRPDIWRENIQAPDFDGYKDEIIGESGLKLISEERHGKIIIDPDLP